MTDMVLDKHELSNFNIPQRLFLMQRLCELNEVTAICYTIIY